MEFKSTYTKLFETNHYNRHLDSEYRFQYVLDIISANQSKIKTILDVGSGRGQLLRLIAQQFPNLEISSADLSRFHDLKLIPFYEINLCEPQTLLPLTSKGKFDLITCLDVLEHLHEENIDYALSFIQKCSKASILTIANHSDVQDGIEVHLIQRDFSFWQTRLERFFNIKQVQEKYSGRLYLTTLTSKN